MCEVPSSKSSTCGELDGEEDWNTLEVEVEEEVEKKK